MVILGLTGGIATGKSTVAKMFIDEGIPVIDTDKIARDLLQKGTDTYHKIVECFSEDILFVNNDINRKKLGQIIFRNSKKRLQLNDLIHPKVREIVEYELERNRKLEKKIVVVDVPLLFETDYHKLVDKSIVVFCNSKEQISRLMSRDNIEKEYAMMKINAQMDLAEKVKIADYVIDNSLSILNTKKDFTKILKDIEVI